MKVTLQTERYLRAYKVFKVNENTYQYTIDLEKSSSPCGFNYRNCVKLFTKNGWENIVDNRFLGIEDIDDFYLDDIKTIKVLEENFKIFEAYIKELEA